MAKRKSHKRIGEKDFKQVKDLLALNLTVKQVSGITGRSTGTIGLIKRAATLGDYIANIHTYLMKYEARKNAKKEVELTPETESDQEVHNPETSVEHSLIRIADALEKMEVHWRTKVDVR